MFHKLHEYGTDPILGLSEEFNEDVNPSKVNLTVGVYCDESGDVPVLNVVRKVEREMLHDNTSKKYLPICGTKEFHSGLKKLVFGEDVENVAISYSLGGTGGLRIGTELIRALPGHQTVWCSNPTWGNHFSIMEEAGVNFHFYPYQHMNCSLDVDGILNSLHSAKKGDFVLLHGCCHNPTGVDPTQNDWSEIFHFMEKKGLVPFFDIAYHGFNRGLEEDIWAIRQAAKLFPVVVVVYSFSKVLGMYGERAGGILIKVESSNEQKVVQSNLARISRCMHSNPPVHGARIVERIITDGSLLSEWYSELECYRKRLIGIRQAFSDKLAEKKVDYSDVSKQRGLFSFLPVTISQARLLRSRYAVYMLDNGRVNIAGLSERNIDYVVEALEEVIKSG